MNAITETVTESKALKVSTLLVVLALLSACGAKTTPRTTASFSGGGPTLSTPLTNSYGEGVAECLPFDTTTSKFSGRATTYYSDGVLQEDAIRMRITSLTDAFDTNSKVFVQFFRWKIIGTNTAEVDANPLQFTIENSLGYPLHKSGETSAAQFTAIDATTLAQLRTANNMTGSGTIDFFSKTALVVRGVDYNWQALKAVIYDGSTSPASVLGQVDLLMPVIQANPNKYATSHDSLLTSLHPFYSQRTQSLSESEWASRSKSYCF